MDKNSLFQKKKFKFQSNPLTPAKPVAEAGHSKSNPNTTSQLKSSFNPLEEEEEQAIESKKRQDEDSEEDPLDSFMADLNEQAKSEPVKIKPKLDNVFPDDDKEDMMESYIKSRKGKPTPVVQGRGMDSDEEVYATARALDEAEGYDESVMNYDPNEKKDIEPLQPVDHSAINYVPVKKYFYRQHKEIEQLTDERVKQLREDMEVKVRWPEGVECPKPCIAFAHFQFDQRLLSRLTKSMYETPTPIQQQAVPCGLSGLDIIGVAKTGSGKTAAYLWPLIVHVLGQPPLNDKDGPIGLVLAPTRELAQQIGLELKKFAKNYGHTLRSAVVTGGASKLDQFKELRSGVEVIIATPGRLIDLIKMKATSLTRVTYLVLDEADRMLDLGFEPQVVSIAKNVRPDRQTLLFSATFPNSIEQLTLQFMTKPIRITVGSVGQVSDHVEQNFLVVSETEHKWSALLALLSEHQPLDQPLVLIFVATKGASELLSTNLIQAGHQSLALNGDMQQFERDDVIKQFRNQKCCILVATDVAARGLDVPGIGLVINYDRARDVDSYVHRVGRTGRANTYGQAVTYLTDEDDRFAADLVRNMQSERIQVPHQLMKLAMTNTKFKRSTERGNNFQRGRGGPPTGGNSRNRNGGIGFHNPPSNNSRRQKGSKPSSSGYINFVKQSDKKDT